MSRTKRLKEKEGRVWMGFIWPWVKISEHNNKCSGSTRCWEFLGNLLKKDYASRVWWFRMHAAPHHQYSMGHIEKSKLSPLLRQTEATATEIRVITVGIRQLVQDSSSPCT
jgi:hypothetical protein